MPKKLLKCPNCLDYAINYVGQRSFCDKCGTKYVNPHPPRFSMHTNPKYLSYIRKLKELSKNNT
ncbi:MAG: nucleolar RNA-binding Nop10p family protein [Candidatus Hodarchaeales archaeon]